MEKKIERQMCIDFDSKSTYGDKYKKQKQEHLRTVSLQIMMAKKCLKKK